MISIFTKCIEKICCKISKSTCMFEMYYKNIVYNEVILGDIKESDNVLCIGGGAMPCSAIQISKLTGSNVTVIDTDIVAVKKANQHIKNLGMSHKIKVLVGNGLDFCINDFDVIHVALQVKPKDKVIKHIWDNCSVGTRILIRKPKKSLELFYSYVDESTFIDNAKYAKQVNSTMKETCLLVKSEEKNSDEKVSATFYRNSMCSNTVAAS
ncbi:MDR/zinc-dependent alcohol dehydrogenase-like family protein [Alkalithermobacter paradoxus]|uniref:Nicotianamine synthase protein n=1 Tax=Alkalithermobacter paradoxus TaxID=29349 RepID=A0A1V4I878_9FIRM|nr:nicotianamine synthase protein [[Clostridium] thermoalcaliphilum]